MIPFASQRGSGQDLATHLLNEFDNEYMELADLRGAIAEDLHGAFAEWEAQAKAMTKCKNYLYSLSINPDHRQGVMPRELYGEYIERVEEALGLVGQPRAVVMHIKEGREHAHVVWSRVDIQEMKAIHMAFDHDKLMSVTRQFARDHDIELAPGYHRLEDRKRQTYRQLSLYERAQTERTGKTREDHQKVVTELWQGRDTPTSFIQALEYHGYILAQGKRPFVLVDINGHTNSLPKLVDEKAVTQATIAKFLGDAGDRANLPTVDEAKEIAARHRTALKEHQRAEAQADKRDQLKASQAARRAKLEQETAELKLRQEQARAQQTLAQTEASQSQQQKFDARVKLIQEQRAAAAPTGLAGFLARVSGVELVRSKIHAYQDRKRDAAHEQAKNALGERQALERQELDRRHAMQKLDMARKRRAMEQTEERERQSLEKHLAREAQMRHVARGPQPSPNLSLHLRPPGRAAVPHKAKHRHTNQLATELQVAKQRVQHGPEPSPDAQKLQDDFAKATRGDMADRKQTSGGEQVDSTTQDPKEPDTDQRAKRKFTRNAVGLGKEPGQGRER